MHSATCIYRYADGYTHSEDVLAARRKNATSHLRNLFLAPDTPLNRNLHGHRRCPYNRLRATTAGEDRKKINEDEEERYPPDRSGGNGGREVIS